MPKTIIYRTDGTSAVRWWLEGEYPDLSWLQDAVGGYVTIVYLGGNRHLYCDEDGEMKLLPKNNLFHERFGPISNTPHGYLLGNLVLCEGFSRIGKKNESDESDDDFVVYELE